MSEPWNKEVVKELLYKANMYGLSEQELKVVRHAWEALQVEIGELQRRSIVLGSLIKEGTQI